MGVIITQDGGEGHVLQKKAALLQTGASITNWGKSYYKIGLVIQYIVRQ